MRGSTMRVRRGLVALAAGVGLIALLSPMGAAGAAKAKPPKPSKTVSVQLLAFNDFHGNLEPPAGSSGRLVLDHRINPATGLPVDVTSDTLVPPGLGGVFFSKMNARGPF